MLRLKFIETVDRATAVRDRGFYAPEALGKSRRLTPEGYLICEAVPIARTGMQLYHASELAGAPITADENGVIRVERTPEEVFRPDTIASYEGKPLTVDHPPEFVNPQNRKHFEVGHCQHVRRGTGQESDLLLADLVVKDPKAIRFVNAELPQISCGYDAGYEEIAPGRARQVNLIANHLAMLRRGRAGPRVAVRDHSIISGAVMKTNDSLLSAVYLGKRIALGEVYEGGLRARLDYLTDKLRELSTPITPPNTLTAESADMVIDLGDVSNGLDALEKAVADAIKLKSDLAVGQTSKLKSELESKLGVVAPLSVSDLIKRMNCDSAELREKEAQVHDAASPPELAPSPPRMPTSIADMNQAAKDFYGNGAE